MLTFDSLILIPASFMVEIDADCMGFCYDLYVYVMVESPW